ncbi:exodeoxyribonuclease III [Orbaceae bacterium ESL0721]|nr:exodeoxyribonuclease III [Orbaceae bacterium ESL0721]
MNFISFNVNGLRARIHQLTALINKYHPDVIALQETKVHNDQFPINDLEQFGYHLSYHGQKRYYGVAFLTKEKPLSVQYGLPTDEESAQCRLITIELATRHGNLTVVNGYFPQGENLHHDTKYSAKNKFYRDVTNYLFEKKIHHKLSLIMGDMNICPSDLDVGINDDNRKRWLKSGKCSFLPEEREWLNRLMSLGYTDTYRKIYPHKRSYSWFDYRSRKFDIEAGLRIDLILASRKLESFCHQVGIDHEIRVMERPSDHAPVWAQFAIE